MHEHSELMSFSVNTTSGSTEQCKSQFVLEWAPFLNNSQVEDKDNFLEDLHVRREKKMMLSDYISLFTKKLKLIIDQIKTYWTSITMVSNTYTYTKTILFPITITMQAL